MLIPLCFDIGSLLLSHSLFLRPECQISVIVPLFYLFNNYVVMTMFLDPYLVNLYSDKTYHTNLLCNRRVFFKVRLISLIDEVVVSSLYCLSCVIKIWCIFF